MKIIIAAGIFPPQIGGPAQYAKNIAGEFRKQGHFVSVLTYKLERYLPSGIRHGLFFLRMLFSLPGKDFVIALDTFSVGLPAVFACRILGKKIIVRTGGDFLWESYVERTGDLVLFKNFYKIHKERWSKKERYIFNLTKWTLQNTNAVVFSTEWQKNIFTEAYTLDPEKNRIIENFYGPKIESFEPAVKNFVAGTRPLKWKNIPLLKQAFTLAEEKNEGISLDTSRSEYGTFLEKIQHAHAVILVSLGDISPNMVLDAVRANKPFILTRENGLYSRLKDIGIFVDPQNEIEIANAIEKLCEPFQYAICKKKIELFHFTHTWTEIAVEFLSLYKTL